MAGNLQADCTSVLHDCDRALQAEQKVNALDQQIIAEQGKVIADQKSVMTSEEFWKPIAIGGFVVSVSLATVLFFKK